MAARITRTLSRFIPQLMNDPYRAPRQSSESWLPNRKTIVPQKIVRIWLSGWTIFVVSCLAISITGEQGSWTVIGPLVGLCISLAAVAISGLSNSRKAIFVILTPILYWATVMGGVILFFLVFRPGPQQ